MSTQRPQPSDYDWIFQVDMVEGHHPFHPNMLRNRMFRYITHEYANVWAIQTYGKAVGAALEPNHGTVFAPNWLLYETYGHLYGGPVLESSRTEERGPTWRCRILHPNVRLVNPTELDPNTRLWIQVVERFPTRLWLNRANPTWIPLGPLEDQHLESAPIRTILDHGGGHLVLMPFYNSQSRHPYVAALLALFPDTTGWSTLYQDAHGQYQWRTRGGVTVRLAPSPNQKLSLPLGDTCYEVDFLARDNYYPMTKPIRTVYGEKRATRKEIGGPHE